MVNYTRGKNKSLNDYHIYDPLLTRGDIERYNEYMRVVKMSEEENSAFKEATSGDVVKFENKGDAVQGNFLLIEESSQYPSSYLVKVKDGEDIKVVFVSNIVADLIKTNSIKVGQMIRIEYLGKKTSEKSGKEYNDYKLLYQ